MAQNNDASGGSKWAQVSPDTPLSQLTAGDLMEAIGWALSGAKDAGYEEGVAAPKPTMTLDRAGSRVMGWKETDTWGVWNSSWWGIQKK
ncbi:MAG TPA: hypothetical protein VGE04_11165 [Chloroflexia bacterium]